MGNVQTTHQKIEQMIQNELEATGRATVTQDCTQDVTILSSGAVYLNCNGFRIDQTCTSYAEVDMNTVAMALQNASLSSEAEQIMEGIAINQNISNTDQDMRSEIINTLKANCDASNDNVLTQTDHIDLRNSIFDCTENPGAHQVHITQYGDAQANCVVKQLVDAAQSNTATAQTLQDNKGLTLPDFGACLGVLALVIAAPVVMGAMGGKKKNNKTLVQQVMESSP